jgi:hypothetical protein
VDTYEVSAPKAAAAGSLRASRRAMFSLTSPYGRMWLQILDLQCGSTCGILTYT